MNARSVTIAAVVSVALLGGVGFLLFKQFVLSGGGSGVGPGGGDVSVDGTGGGDGRDGGRSGRAGGASSVSTGNGGSAGPDSLGGAPGSGASGPTGAPGRTGSGARGATDGTAGTDGTGESSVGPDGRFVKGSAQLLAFVEDGDHRAVSGVTVTLSSGKRIVTERTDAAGLATFDNLPQGAYRAQLGKTAKSAKSTKSSGVTLEAVNPIALAHGERRETRFLWLDFDASISGRIVGASREPIPGIAVSARPLGREQRDNPLVRRDTPRRVVSDENGLFELRGLAAGEHVLQTVATRAFPSVRHHVVAPAEEVEIAVYEDERVAVIGIVSDPEGVPIAQATVSSSSGGKRVLTKEDGSYSLEATLPMSPTGRLVVSARKEGHVPAEQILAATDFSGEERPLELEIDFELDAVGESGTLKGQLVSIDGEPVIGERVHLHSKIANVQYNAISSVNGEFEIQSVRAADDYRLWVYPRQGYKDRTLGPLVVHEGENTVDIELDPLAVGVLEGVVVDTDGRPVPRFTLHVRSLKSLANTITTTTDGSGRFRVENVPAGDLLIETRIFPKLSVRGVRVAENQETSVEIPVGRGDQELKGVVEDEQRVAVSGARVVVTWSGQSGGVKSTLYHEVLTDPDGRFTLRGLAVGNYSASVTASGYHPARQTFQVSASSAPDLELKVRKQSQ